MSAPRAMAELLERQLRHRYRAFDRAMLAGVGPLESEFTLGARPPIAWHVRHIGEAIESTRQAVFGDTPEHTSDLAAPPPFPGPMGSPEEGPSEAAVAATGTLPWPALWDDLRRAVQRAEEGLMSRLAVASDHGLNGAPLVTILPAFKSSLPTRQSFLEGHIYHVAYHVGSMAVLRAEMGLD